MTGISATAKFEFNRVQNVHVSGITFQGCRNGAVVQIITATSTAFIGSLFISNSAGIQLSRVTRAIVMRSNFTQNNGISFQASNSQTFRSKTLASMKMMDLPLMFHNNIIPGSQLTVQNLTTMMVVQYLWMKVPNFK